VNKSVLLQVLKHVTL